MTELEYEPALMNEVETICKVSGQPSCSDDDAIACLILKARGTPTDKALLELLYEQQIHADMTDPDDAVENIKFFW